MYNPIAVLGYGGVFPSGGINNDSFWESIINGTNGIHEIPKSYWEKNLYFSEDKSEEDKTYCKLGGIIPDYIFPLEKYKEFNIGLSNVQSLNKSQQMTLDTILQAVHLSKKEISYFANNKTGYFLGNMLGDAELPNFVIQSREDEILSLLEECKDFKELNNTLRNEILSGLKEKVSKKNNSATYELMQTRLLSKIKSLLGIKGMSTMIDGACSASGLVIDEAIKQIHAGNIDTCIVSAVLGNMVVSGNIAFSKIGGLSEVGAYPLDSRASGLIPGEGAGTVILKDLKKAMEDGDCIYGVIRGSGVASDGKGKSIYAPSSSGQTYAMEKSLINAGLNISDIDYIETHATGTLVGDKVELESIIQLCNKEKSGNVNIALGSVKSQIGHAFSAAGMANLIKVIEGIRRKEMPPTHNFKELPKGINLDKSGLYVNTKLKSWDSKNGETPRRAMVNAFGFGGINANILIEEYVEIYHKKILQNTTGVDIDSKKDIAIVGIGCIDGNGNNKDTWWSSIASNYTIKPESLINRKRKNSLVEKERHIGLFIKNFSFPFTKFRIPPLILKQIDFSQQLSLYTAAEAIEDYGFEKIKEGDMGVYVGSMLGLESALLTDYRIRTREYLNLLSQVPEFHSLEKERKEKICKYILDKVREYLPKVEEDTLPGYMDNISAGRVANFFDARGTNAVYDSDSSSFSAALYQAILSLESCENRHVLVGGVHSNMMPEMIDIFNEFKKSERGAEFCNGKNLIPAEGSVFFVLKRMADVLKDEKVYAKITNIDNSNVSNNKSDFKFDSENSDIPFYFGADDGFDMLYNVLKLYKNSTPSNASLMSKSMFDKGYKIELCSSDYEDTGDSTAVADTGSNDNVILNDFKIKYFCGNQDELFDEVDVNSNSKKFMDSSYKVAIVYKNENELKKKLDLLKNI